MSVAIAEQTHPFVVTREAGREPFKVADLSLAERGRKVTVLEEGPHLAPQMAIPRRWRTLHELRTRDTALHTGVRVHAIEKVGVVVSLGDEKRTIPADQVILASSVVPNHDIVPEIEALGAQAWMTGTGAELFDALPGAALRLSVTENEGRSALEVV